MNDYDCTNDVMEHKRRVEYWMRDFEHQLKSRAENHDNSKLNDPMEKALFDKWTPELKRLTYGTDEYKAALDGMGEGVRKHYEANRHHPEHYPNGINGMTIVDLVEMLVDWMAAAEAKNTHVDLERAAARFGLCDQLVEIFANTLHEEDFWMEAHNCPVPHLCPPEMRSRPIEGITPRKERQK